MPYQVSNIQLPYLREIDPKIASVFLQVVKTLNFMASNPSSPLPKLILPYIRELDPKVASDFLQVQKIINNMIAQSTPPSSSGSQILPWGQGSAFAGNISTNSQQRTTPDSGGTLVLGAAFAFTQFGGSSIGLHLAGCVPSTGWVTDLDIYDPSSTNYGELTTFYNPNVAASSMVAMSNNYIAVNGSNDVIGAIQILISGGATLPTIVQKTSGWVATNVSGTLSLTLPSAPTAGNTLILFYGTMQASFSLVNSIFSGSSPTNWEGIDYELGYNNQYPGNSVVCSAFKHTVVSGDGKTWSFPVGYSSGQLYLCAGVLYEIAA